MNVGDNSTAKLPLFSMVNTVTTSELGSKLTSDDSVRISTDLTASTSIGNSIIQLTTGSVIEFTLIVTEVCKPELGTTEGGSMTISMVSKLLTGIDELVANWLSVKSCTKYASQPFGGCTCKS